MDQFAKETLPVSLEEEMRRSYLDYAMSVIVGRALPDVRDGLKPVHRRVLYAMHEANNVWNRSYVKCARIVGEVLGISPFRAACQFAQEQEVGKSLVIAGEALVAVLVPHRSDTLLEHRLGRKITHRVTP